MNRFRQTLQRRISEARLRRRLRRELDELGISGPISMAEVCTRLSKQRGKPIQLIAYPFEIPGPFGLWLATPSADYLLYQAETTKLHQEHIIAHELGHLLAAHQSDDDDDEIWQELMPDIPPDIIRRALRRTSYDSDQEREAETVATLLLEAAAVVQSITMPSTSARARRAQQALGDRQNWL